MRADLELDIRNNRGIATRKSLGNNQFTRLVRNGQLVRILPGVAVLPGRQADLPTRVRAALAFDPDAIVMGETAAALTWWPGLARDHPVRLASQHHHTRTSGFSWEQVVLPPDLWNEIQGLRLASAALSVLDMIPARGGLAVDEALRRRAVTLSQLNRALAMTKGRPGNVTRRRLLADSRDEPWSEYERLAHRLLRAARIRGWRTNVQVPCPGMLSAYLDVAFPPLRLALEIDGVTIHGTAAQLEHDHRRDTGLIRQGWMVVRFTGSQVAEPGWTDLVAEIVVMRCGHHGANPRDYVWSW